MNQNQMEMNHIEEFELHEYLDDEIAPPRRAAVDAHLATCADCRRQLTNLRDLFAVIESISNEAPTHDLSPAVVATLQRVPDPLPAPWRLLTGQILVAGLALAFVWGFVDQAIAPLTNLQLAPNLFTEWRAALTVGQQVFQNSAAEIERWRNITDADWLPVLSPVAWTALLGIAALLWLGGTRWGMINRNDRNGDWI
jgi:anti-sigma factor RsiW